MKKNISYLIILTVAIFTLGSSAFAQCGGSKKKDACDTCTGCMVAPSGSASSMQKTDKAEGNIWTTSDGTKYFTCPVMKGEKKVSEAESFSIVDNVKYYHCCPACEKPFQANPGKYLKNQVLYGNISRVDMDGKKHFRDPVSGKEGVIDENVIFFDHMNKRFYFSGKKSMKKFKKSPSKFV